MEIELTFVMYYNMVLPSIEQRVEDWNYLKSHKGQINDSFAERALEE